MGTTSHVAARSADIAKSTQPTDSSSTTLKQPAPKIKGQSKQCKDKVPEADWEFEAKALDEAEVHYPEKGISHLETGFT